MTKQLKKPIAKSASNTTPTCTPTTLPPRSTLRKCRPPYSEIMRIKQGGGTTYRQSSQSYGQSGYGQQYQDPFSGGGFGFGPFGFGYYSTSGSTGGRATAAPQATPSCVRQANYIRSGFYEEAMNTLNGIPTANRTAQWHYYAALANQGLGNNIRAQEEARTAVSMEPNNYAYQNLLDQLQSPGRSYTSYQQPYAQPSGRPGSFCLSFWLYLLVCNVLSWCCCGGRGGFYIC